ncbi:MAG: SRPBCC family protein [Trueperaceae bacterium]
MQYHDESYMGNQDYPNDYVSAARRRYETTLLPQHDHRSQNKVTVALAVGALAVAGGLTYMLLRQGSKQNGVSSREYQTGIRAANSVTIMKSPEELYNYWRKLENLPKIMSHLETVEETSDVHSHWVAKAPLGATVEWNAEITEDIPNQKIAWRSLPNSQVPNEGYVEFNSAGEGRGTVVHVSLTYTPPGSAAGAGIAKLFGQEPNQQIAKDMRTFQQMMEIGESVRA